MRKIISIFVFTILTMEIHGQTIPEPEFIGEALLVNVDNHMYRKLPKERGIIKANNFMGAKSTKIILGPVSPLLISDKTSVGVIVKVADNSYDPISMIQVFRFTTYGLDQRVVELSWAQVGKYAAVAEGNTKDYVTFSAEKYGESSYLIKFPIFEGHYGIITNGIDEHNLLIATFSVFSQQKKDLEESNRRKEEAEWLKREQDKLERQQKRASKRYNRRTKTN